MLSRTGECAYGIGAAGKQLMEGLKGAGAKRARELDCDDKMDYLRAEPGLLAKS